MRISIAAFLLACMLARAGRAQIVYEPVRYQYGTNVKFYYGGADPNVIAFGEAQPSPGPAQITVYSDARPYENVAIYGYTISDARNEAYANVPRYFRKRELVAAGEIAPDGTLVIGPQAQPVPLPPPSDPKAVSAAPILIIPRGQTLPPPPKSDKIIIVMNRH